MFRNQHIVGAAKAIVILISAMLLATCVAAGEVNCGAGILPASSGRLEACTTNGSLFDLVQQKAAPGEYLFQPTANGFSAVNTPNRLCA